MRWIKMMEINGCLQNTFGSEELGGLRNRSVGLELVINVRIVWVSGFLEFCTALYRPDRQNRSAAENLCNPSAYSCTRALLPSWLEYQLQDVLYTSVVCIFRKDGAQIILQTVIYLTYLMHVYSATVGLYRLCVTVSYLYSFTT